MLWVLWELRSGLKLCYKVLRPRVYTQPNPAAHSTTGYQPRFQTRLRRCLVSTNSVRRYLQALLPTLRIVLFAYEISGDTYSGNARRGRKAGQSRSQGRGIRSSLRLGIRHRHRSKAPGAGLLPSCRRWDGAVLRVVLLGTENRPLRLIFGIAASAVVSTR